MELYIIFSVELFKGRWETKYSFIVINSLAYGCNTVHYLQDTKRNNFMAWKKVADMMFRFCSTHREFLYL